MAPYAPFFRHERYPRSLAVDFRKLECRSLLKYVDKHGIPVRPDSSQAELAVAVARHFEEQSVNEEDVLCRFVKRCTVPGKEFLIPDPAEVLINLENAQNESANPSNNGGVEYGRGHRAAAAAAVAAAAAAAAAAAEGEGNGNSSERPPSRTESATRSSGASGNGNGNGVPSTVGSNGPNGNGSAKKKRARPKTDDEDSVSGSGRQLSDRFDDVGMGAAGSGGNTTPHTRRSGDRAGAAATVSGGSGGGGGPGGKKRHRSNGADTTPSRGRPPQGRIASGDMVAAKLVETAEEPPPDAAAAVAAGGVDGEAGSGSGGKKQKNSSGAATTVMPIAEKNAGWVLARALRYSAETAEWEVQDEDSEEVKIVPEHFVRRISPSAHGLSKGDTCLAIFPDTTVFYLADVYKLPKPEPGSSKDGKDNRDPEVFVVVRFRDDEDAETRTTPARRLPATHVIPLPEGPENDDEDDANASDADSGGSPDGSRQSQGNKS